MRVLVLDAYSDSGRRSLISAGGTEAGRLYERMFEKLEPEIAADLGRPADASFALPMGVELGDYDGVVWTGSDLTVSDSGDDRVARQIGLAQEIARAGVPSFGSCYGIQIAAVAAGGECVVNPRGREFGVSRNLSLSEAGRSHPMYAGKPESFQGFTCHVDMVSAVPEGAVVLAGNSFSTVQSLAVGAGKSDFWAVQYHPEYDLSEVAALCRLRSRELIEQGFFADAAEAEVFIERLESLHAEPGRQDLREILGVGEDLLDAISRTIEVRNWIEQRVRPRADGAPSRG